VSVLLFLLLATALLTEHVDKQKLNSIIILFSGNFVAAICAVESAGH
jgi:Na+/serine symporter